MTRVDPALVGRIGPGVTFRTMPEGEVLVRQENHLDRIVLVISGRLKAYRTAEDGHRHTWKILGPGDCICFAPAHLRANSPVTIQSMSDSQVAFVDGRHLEEVSRGSRQFAQDVLECLLSRHTHAADAAIMSVRTPVRRRIASTLLDLARAGGATREDGSDILVDEITHEELASLTGSVREVVSRTLEQFQREGIIRTGRGRVFISSPGRLRDIGNGHTP